ncbi:MULTISPECIES: 4-(cytidine 5'-diphospho)-2-C-methyl-D-erythritol kinase [unclassified Moraxella]|uniref:4-(cytidine 5'-diphospho)-2-C-methyl-D-erythritol kinase n=1 Tax=unclassified Moraxella TaxID=2685852 RepID=UPI00359DE524
MTTLTLFSPAKINLFLHITGQRADGYHNLQSVFRTLDFGDELTFRLHDDDKLVQLIGGEHLTERLDDNLIVKAVHTLAQSYPSHAKAVHITLSKHIPTGAGLGGGSSNCATTLIAINQLWQLNLDCQTLIDIAATLGADVPFFIFAHFHRTDAIATGIGELLSPISLPTRQYLLLMPNIHLATAHFFRHPHLIKDTPIMDDLQRRYEQFDGRLSDGFYNCFESIAINHSQTIKQAMDYLHAIKDTDDDKFCARMTGTGSAVFLPLSKQLQSQAQHLVSNAPCRAIICQSLYGY